MESKLKRMADKHNLEVFMLTHRPKINADSLALMVISGTNIIKDFMREIRRIERDAKRQVNDRI